MKEYDIIIWGASGFTGKLAAEYLIQNYCSNKDLKWAIAGRNEDKLKRIRERLGNEDVPIVIADSNDRSSLDSLTKRTKVMCTTVGPYAKYGSNLVAASLENSTHYCDLSGEIQWIRRMIDAYHDSAKKNKTKMVHCCGFDSIPSDLGVYFLQKEAKSRFGEYAEQITLYVKAMKGTYSGGTIASLQNVFAEAQSDSSVYAILQDPYALNPKGQREGKDQLDITKAEYDPDVDAWVAPFVMAAINTKVVRRSHALAGFPYGKDFRYEEVVLAGKGLKGRLQAHGGALTMALAQAMKPGSAIKKIGDRFLPKPGEGPSKEQRDNGFFNIMILGKLRNGKVIKAKVTGDRDPGYGSTSKMLAEAAICLAKDENDIPETFGSLTPSTAMAEVLLKRLIENAGLNFDILP